MEVNEAVAQINTIWAHVTRVERFRGYRPLTVAGTGICGLLGTLAQPWIVPTPAADPVAYLKLWVAVAMACVALVGLELWGSYLRTRSPLERQLTRRAVTQFVPCLFGGAVFTWIIARYHPDSMVLLPGLWAICFSLGVFASMPYMTPAVGWVAAYYLVTGGLCLAAGRGPATLHPWAMGITFGIGQLLMAGTLLLAEEQRDAQA